MLFGFVELMNKEYLVIGGASRGIAPQSFKNF